LTGSRSVLLPEPHIQVVCAPRLHIRNLVAGLDARALGRLARRAYTIYQSTLCISIFAIECGEALPCENCPSDTEAASDFLDCEPRVSELEAIVSPTAVEVSCRPPLKRSVSRSNPVLEGRRSQEMRIIPPWPLKTASFMFLSCCAIVAYFSYRWNWNREFRYLISLYCLLPLAPS
jgi:hypothetical protein